MPMIAWEVYNLNRFDEYSWIDTVFFDSKMDKKDVLKSLINHDGYDSEIAVRKHDPKLDAKTL